MNADAPTPLERLQAGETIPFECLSDDDLRALIPDFADRWRAAMLDVERTLAESESAA